MSQSGSGSSRGTGNTPLVLVIGGGQAGLAAGYHLKAAGIAFRIVEAGARIGDSWRKRHASLTLFTPRAFSGLPGFPLAGDPEGYATRDEFAAYLEIYAAHFELPVTCGTRIERLAKDTEGNFSALLGSGAIMRARHVIIATSGFQMPVVPEISRDLDTGVAQLTAEAYRGPWEFAPGEVLVVGDGATGRNIAVELAATHPVLLATGKPRKLFPERVLGKSIWWWLNRLGLMRVSANSRLGRLMRRADPFPDRDRSLGSLPRRGIRIYPRVVSAVGRMVTFADGRTAKVATIVWATGYRDDVSWLDIPDAVDAAGSFLHHEGLSPLPGLYFVGRPWQRNRASALIMGVGPDAASIVAHIGRVARSGEAAKDSAANPLL